MNILYLNHYAGSPRHGMEYRPYYLAREWVRAGHRVRTLAADFSHVRSRQPQQLGVELIDGIEYEWFASPPYQGNGLGRVKNIWAFQRALWAANARIVAEVAPQVVIASSTYPMDIWVARRLARMAKAKLVFEVHDLWPLSPIELSGMSPHHPFALLCGWAEKTAYRDADVVVSMLPKVHDYMASRGLDLRKLHIVPNGISPDDWAAAPDPASQDIVFQATVFSSLLQDETQERLAQAMWQWLKPGGAVLWYDFCMDNPRNREVRGVPLSRVQALFPQGRLKAQRLTLAPPIARRVCRLHPSLYHLFNALPLLRSHRLVWIQKS
ncbi:MAG: hypothetical protein C4K60_10060 [Ideonella sp. MAG2]|nr:MAG: hypothetical protein C4K60_10060 [Ideonella sp. MAG2]